jgi:hypothetical protein
MINRERAKQMFRDDKNSQGCYKSVLTKIDLIYDSIIDVDYKSNHEKLIKKLNKCDSDVLDYIIYLESKKK